MRISTAGFHQATIDALNARSADLAKLQGQIASGKRVQTPADDPAAAVHILELERARAQSTQYSKNADVATNRLSFEEQALADINNLLQRVRELTVQANSGTLDAVGREAIAVELDERTQELIDLANRRDATGEYLFSGYSTLTQPFSRGVNGVTYAGDHGVRLIQTSSTQRVADGHSGYEVFMNVVEGNGTFATAADAANTGTGVIGPGSVSDPGAWVPDDYTIRFTTATDWEVLDGSNAVIATGTFVPGGSVSFNGATVSIQGQPAANDTFAVTPSGTVDMFTMLDQLRTALRAPAEAPADRARYATSMATALTQLDRAMEHAGDLRSQVGARLNAIEETQASLLDQDLELDRALSELRDLDFAAALSRLTLQQAGLEAAQASYARLSQLSLFDYIR